jgi:serine/threonine-protein kinase
VVAGEENYGQLMPKVFTITAGLENMGALRTGGQGSIYKGRRIGEIITAIKLLPTPIYSESEDDKNFRDFQNEVQKLKRVNQEHNPNVVKILSSGLSETGNFPFIEMDYIEGPDLEELLKPPHDPIFTIQEVIKVAEQLSNALAHCHKQDVKHGDVKSNNVKYNIHTGNYVLLDFGLAIMSDEQRRTSLRHAGAVEFMAPEQNEGEMLFQTDVYSFGVVMFELLAGRVPFPLQDKGETARNIVRLAHLETPPPDVIVIRREMMPPGWSREMQQREMLVPEWIINMIYKCLNKKPEGRFADGAELHEYIIYNRTHAFPQYEAEQSVILKTESERIIRERDELQQQISAYKVQLSARETELAELRKAVAAKDSETGNFKEGSYRNTLDTGSKKGVSTATFTTFLLLTVALGIFAVYAYFFKDADRPVQHAANTSSVTAPADTPTNAVAPVKKKPIQKKKIKNADSTVRVNKKLNQENKDQAETASQENNTGRDQQDAASASNSLSNKYTVISKAYFYSSPDETTRRNAYINHWNNAVLTPSDDMDGFIYVTYKNDEGQVTRGWLRKKDLRLLNK